ncbi:MULTISPECIES: HepT-like ribonuclease domain-containing protein [Dermacoccus]
MRNIRAHEYGVVDHAIVWAVVDSRLTALAQKLARLLGES